MLEGLPAGVLHFVLGVSLVTKYRKRKLQGIPLVAFDKFGQPIGALVDDCKATPKETLWQKLKKHL